MNKFLKGWHEGMSVEDTKDLAYWERNVLALLFAHMVNDLNRISNVKMANCGWYFDTDNNWDGWKRVISLFEGSVTFHVPDDFDMGTLKEIEPNWNGNTSEQKWTKILELVGCNVDVHD